MPSLSFSNSTVIVLAGLLALALVWLVVLTIVIWQLQVARKKVGAIVTGAPGVIDVIEKALVDIEGLTAKHERLAVNAKRQRALLGKTIRHVGVVRFDAFVEVGGRLSFAVALLNDEGDGLILSSINGRTDSRVYVKPMIEGKSEFPLSEEEEEAIRRAFEEVKT